MWLAQAKWDSRLTRLLCSPDQEYKAIALVRTRELKTGLSQVVFRFCVLEKGLGDSHKQGFILFMVLVFRGSETVFSKAAPTWVVRRQRKGYRETGKTPMNTPPGTHFLQGGPVSYLSTPPNNGNVELLHQEITSL